MSQTGVFDFTKQFQDMVEAGMSAIKSIFPVKGPRRTMQLDRIWLDDNKRTDDFASQKDAKLKQGTWDVPIMASLTLIDNASGTTVDKIDRMKLMGIPKWTPRYSSIIDGNDYQTKGQLRLKSGAYSAVAADGSFVTQVMTELGHNYRIEMDPQTSIFTITPSTSTARIKLYPVLLALGLGNNDIRQAWGEQVANANAQASANVTDTEVQKFHKALFGSVPTSSTSAVTRINTYFQDKTKISPETTLTTLRQAFDKVSPELFLASGKRLLTIARQEELPDDKNSPVNKEYHAIDNFIKERINDAIPKIRARIAAAMERRDDIRQVVSSDQFTNPIRSFFSKTGLASPTKQTNPVEIASDQFKLTLMGPGGIKSDRAVPDELRHVHGGQMGFIDPLQTPESGSVGTTLSVALGASRKGNDLVQSLLNLRTGQVEEVTPTQSWGLITAFPGEFKREGTKWVPIKSTVHAMKNHKEAQVPANEVTHLVINPKMLFSVSANLIPFLSSNSGPRAAMGSKHIEQALSLIHREAPLVQTVAAPGLTFEGLMGKESAILSRVDGSVKEITPDEIIILDAAGAKVPHGIYNNFPLNQKTFYHSDVKVRVGDKVTKGQLLADSNYTKNGVSALGVNARVGYVPAKGYNFEDGVVISEKMAERLTSEHMYRYQIDLNPTTILSKGQFLAKYPGLYKNNQVDRLDQDGVVRVGQKVSKGDPIALKLVREEVTAEDKILSKLRRGTIDPYRNRAVLWEENFDGEVTDVVHTPKYVLVVAKTKEPAQIGDKMSTRHAAKGVITRILPDAEMPHTLDGTPMEVLLNPNGIPSRMNVGQLQEMVAAHVASKAGEPFLVDNFALPDQTAHVLEKAKAFGISDKEILIDPATGKQLESPIGTGILHFMKLNHPTRSKYSARSFGPYLDDLTPASGEGTGGQSMDSLTVYDMLAHGAKHNLREMGWLKSQANPEFWRAFMTGQYLPPPKPTFAYRKFTELLKGAGINVEKSGDNLALMPMLDRHVAEMSRGEIREPLVMRAKDLAPEKYGLYDPKITGGLRGETWGHIKLTEPVPHPTFEGTIKSLTGLKQEQFDGLVQGKHYLDPATGAFSQVQAPGLLTGGTAIKHMLSTIDVDAQLAELQAKAKTAKGTALDQINKKTRYLMASKKTGIHPQEYVVETIPVVPPIFRPSYPDQQGNLRHSDLTSLYRDVMMVNKSLREIPTLPDKEKQDLRRDVYDGFKAVAGLGDRTLTPDKDYKGIMDMIAGDVPKRGYFQDKLVRKRQDLSGRSTATPDPNMGIDEIGIPEQMAWSIFRPHIIREMTQNRGKTFLQAQEMVDQKAPQAKEALDLVTSKIPVMMNRAPSLHKFSIMSFMPKLVQGQALKIHPLIVKGFNADFDGDTLAIHTPVLPKAIEEAKKMLPSQNLFNPSTNQLMTVPDQEMVQGLYYLSQTPAGLAKIHSVMPPKYHDNAVWTAAHMKTVLDTMAHEVPQDFPKIVNDLKDLGNEHAYTKGVSIGLSDMVVNRKGRDAIMASVLPMEQEIVKRKMTDAQRRDKLSELYQTVEVGIKKEQERALEQSQNVLYHGLKSGMKGKNDQIKQMVMAPVLYNDSTNKPVPILVRKSLAEGLSPAEYWAGLYGARKGMIDRAIQTSEPGAFSKETVRTAHNYIVTIPDCGTFRGATINMADDLGSKNAVGHLLAKDVPGAGTRDQVVTPELLRKLKQERIAQIIIRSPLYCEAQNGVCQKCYGHSEYRSLPSLGDNVGAIAAHSIGEPATQLVMRTFHTGGVASASGGLSSQFDRINEVVEVPKNLPSATTLAVHSGLVSRIEPNPAGGFKVWVGDHEHFVGPGREMYVKVGDHVEKAQPLSAGKINPHDLLALKGMQTTRDFLSHELHKVYNDSGIPLRKVHSDMIAKAMTDLTHIKDAGDHPDHIPGDYASLSAIDAFNRGTKVNKPVEESVGRRLDSDYGQYRKGQIVTADMVRALKKLGFTSVDIVAQPVTHAPILTPMSIIPQRTTDWMDRLNSTALRNTLTEGVSRGWVSSIRGNKPIPSYVYSANFGEDEGY